MPTASRKRGLLGREASLEAVIFDMDGTLVSSLPVIFHCVNEISSKHLHRNLTLEEVMATFGPPAWVIIKSLTRGLVDEAQDQAVADYYECYRKNVSDRALLFPGITELLAKIRASGNRLSLLTGVEKTLMNHTLDAFDLARYFEILVSGDDVSKAKPAPEGIRLILERMGVEPRKAMIVGDSPADIQAGKNAGILTGAALWSPENRGNPTKEHPDFEFRSVSQLSIFLFPKREVTPDVYFSKSQSEK